MTATERVRELLDERGVEWEAFDDFEPTTQWSTHNGAFVYWARERDGKLLVETTAPFKCSISCTPDRAIEACTTEQAIAATLGREPDEAAIAKLHDRMNVALLECKRTLGIEKADGTIVVPLVYEMHNLLEEAAALGSCSCTNSERTEACLPHFWTHDGVLHVELPKLPESISVRLPDQRDREVGSARVWQYTRDSGTCRVDVLNTGDCAGYECSEYIMHCNGCGHEFGHVLYNEDGDVWMSEPPNYCPNCGAKVVGSTTNNVDAEVDE